MRKRKEVENPFLQVMIADQKRLQDQSESETNVSVYSNTPEGRPSSKPILLQINTGLLNQLEIITESLRKSLPPELQSEFSLETVNELSIVYLISDFRAYNGGDSIAERLSKGWAERIIGTREDNER